MIWFLPFLLLVAFPATADAHTTIKGLGELVSGLVHPVTTPSHVLVLLSLGLWLGQRSPPTLRPALRIFAPLLALALILGAAWAVAGVYPPLLLGIALCTGSLVALEKPLPPLAAGALFAAAALAIGFDSSPEAGSTAAVAKSLIGTWVMALVVVLDVAYYVSRGAGRKWLRTGVRVMGSWIIAVALLVLAFAFRKSAT